MQQAQQREQTERMSWARAMIFAVGFFFIAALLIGQLPGYIFTEMTASSLVGLERGLLALAVVCLGGFLIVQAIVMLFDPKPVVPPIVFSVLGAPLALGGLVIIFAAVLTNNQYFPSKDVTWASVLGGNVLWFPPNSIDLTMVGAVVMGVGIGWVFYSILALRELRSPERGDPGTTPAIRWMITIGTLMLIVFMLFYGLVSNDGLAKIVNSGCPASIANGCGPITGLFIVNTIFNTFLAIAVLCTLGAFALRLHYLMRPVRKRTMSVLYMVGINVAQFGAIFLIAWFVVYPAIAWIHSWSLIGLGDYLTICARKVAIPQSCSFSQQAGYIIDAAVTTSFFVALMGAVAVWKSKRNLVVIGGLTITAVLALATLLTHTAPTEIFIAQLLCGGALVLAAIWTSVARREFAVVGEKNLGCLGMWLVVGTCLLIYIAAFAFFSLPTFSETEPNIPFVPGASIGGSVAPALDAVVVVVLIGLLAGLQFYFLVRNRYKV